MERIQSAISKARQARQARRPAETVAERAATAAPAPGPAGGALGQAASGAAAGVEAAWAGLMEFRPSPAHLERHRIVAQQTGHASAPFDSLRTRLLYLMRDKGWKRLAVTSPGPGCGKTTLCLNLALSLARLPDLRTLALDADFRRPAMGALLGASSGQQFSEVLAGKSAPEAQLLRIGPNLAVGSNRAPTPHSAELLQSPEAAAALERLEAAFQPHVMIFDLPPVLVSDDTVAALDLVDCALIVAAAETTTTAEIDRCERALAERTNVVGVVLNKCRHLEKSEGYGYDYY